MQAAQKTDSARLVIEWDTCHPDVWQRHFAKIPKSNLIQTIEYARAVRFSRQQLTRFGLVKSGDDIAGLVQIQDVQLFKFLNYVLLDRGPLWLPAYNTPENHHAFFALFQEQFHPRFGRSRRILPESTVDISDLGYKKRGDGYQSIWLDLTRSKEELRAHLKQKWRHALNVAERQDMRIERDAFGAHFDWLARVYADDKKQKGYAGPPPAFLARLIEEFAQNKNVLLLRALKGQDPVAAVLVFIHGSSATYQVGWSNAEGRKANAHNLLLWRTALQLKKRGIHWFDLGGLNEEAEGLTRFKEGMGGQKYQLCGVYG